MRSPNRITQRYKCIRIVLIKSNSLSSRRRRRSLNVFLTRVIVISPLDAYIVDVGSTDTTYAIRSFDFATPSNRQPSNPTSLHSSLPSLTQHDRIHTFVVVGWSDIHYRYIHTILTRNPSKYTYINKRIHIVTV